MNIIKLLIIWGVHIEKGSTESPSMDNGHTRPTRQRVLQTRIVQWGSNRNTKTRQPHHFPLSSTSSLLPLTSTIIPTCLYPQLAPPKRSGSLWFTVTSTHLRTPWGNLEKQKTDCPLSLTPTLVWKIQIHWMFSTLYFTEFTECLNFTEFSIGIPNFSTNHP